ncbi:MAG: hypothetical protein Alpg2KO_21150 [Alphaproteobacteria bacterium]
MKVAPPPPPRLYQGAAPAEPIWKSRAVKVSVEPDAPRIAIVLDDLGLSSRKLKDSIALDGPVTLAFLPYGQDLAGQVSKAQQAGHEILLHMPMQPGGEADPGPNPLKPGQPISQAETRLLDAINAVPGIVGFNNHMGSAATADPLLMKAVSEIARREGLIFLDSRTTRFTAIPTAAEAAGADWLERDVFLDHEITPDAINAALSRTEHIARETGHAIAIGHPHPETLTALKLWLPEARKRGFAIVPVSHLADSR